MRDLRALIVGIVASYSGAAVVGCGASTAPAMDAGGGAGDRPDGEAPADGACSPVVTGGMCLGQPIIRYPCGLPPGATPGIYSEGAACTQYCGRLVSSSAALAGCNVEAASGATPATITCFESCAVDGRRPEGYAQPPRAAAHDALQAWLAASAAIEHASVTAFLHLADELAAHDAPASLVARARAAAEDERRHTAWKCALARRHGAHLTLPDVATPPLRDLRSLARENAVEGCVRETWGALLATWQADHAADADAAAVFSAVAADETRHAQLAWDIDAWARASLPPEEARAVEAARAEAAASLRGEALGTADVALRDTFGAPDPATAARLLRSLATNLWQS